MKQAIYKVPGGKLLKIFVDADQFINEVKITGDFFMYPEDGVERLEEAVKGMPLDKEKLTRILENASQDMELFGLDPESIAHTILMTQE